MDPFLLLMINASAGLVGFLLCWAVYVHPKRKPGRLTSNGLPLAVPPPMPWPQPGRFIPSMRNPPPPPPPPPNRVIREGHAPPLPPPRPGDDRIAYLNHQLQQQYHTLSAVERNGLEGHHLKHLILLYTQRQTNRKSS